MAISTAAAILGGAAISGIAGSRASRRAASAQTSADAAAIEEQRRQFDLSRADLAPYRNIGTQALNQLGSLYGFGQPVTPIIADMSQDRRFPRVSGRYANLFNRVFDGLEPDRTLPGGIPLPTGVNPTVPQAPSGMAAFFASPDYNFRRDEGMRGLERSAAARGGAFSGNALRGLSDFNSNLAAGEFGNYFNRLAALSGIGQSATNTGVQAGQNSAANIAQLLSNQGASRASGIMGQANSIGGALNSGLNNWLLYRGGYFGTPPFNPGY